MDAVKRYFRSPAAVIGLILLLVVIAMALSAGILFPRDPLALAGRPLLWPFANPRFPLGTDNSGRDIAAQIFYGARISLLIGGVATLIAVAIGVWVVEQQRDPRAIEDLGGDVASRIVGAERK